MITITVQAVTGSPLTDATVAEAAAVPDVVSAQRSDEEADTLVITVRDDMDAAKKVSNTLARMFPGQPVRWGSAQAS
jgi:hypothetical protein